MKPTTVHPGHSASALGRACAGVVVAAAIVSACTSDDDKEVLPPVDLAMPDNIAPTVDDGQQQIFQVQSEVRLPYRAPNGDEVPKGKDAPYDRPPFHIAADSRVTVRYTISNLDAQQHTVELLVDPWNEFVRYVPGVTIVRDEETQPNFSGIDRFVIVPPKSRIDGIITPDDMVELATDLTIAMSLEKNPPPADSAFAGAALYNRTFDSQNRSSKPDPVLQQYIPPQRGKVAAVTGFELGLRTYEKAKVAVELVIDVQDLNGDRVVMDGDSGKKLGRPGTVLSPPAGGAD
jgi:hypothetical protein